MKRTPILGILIFFFISLVSFSVAIDHTVFAQKPANSNAPANIPTKDPPKNPPSPGTQPPGGSQTSESQSNKLFNPIKYNNLADLIIGLTKSFVLLIGVVSVAFIVLGGAELVTSAGNQEALEKGKKTITWAVLGMIVALLAFSIVAIIQDLIGVK